MNIGSVCRCRLGMHSHQCLPTCTTRIQLMKKSHVLSPVPFQRLWQHPFLLRISHELLVITTSIPTLPCLRTPF